MDPRKGTKSDSGFWPKVAIGDSHLTPFEVLFGPLSGFLGMKGVCKRAQKGVPIAKRGVLGPQKGAFLQQRAFLRYYLDHYLAAVT